MTLDATGQEIISFESRLRNASRLGTYADLMVSMFASGTWRQYSTALGSVQWRAHEFDYFLISCDARYEDIARIRGWDTVRAAKLAEAMTGEPSAHRRALVDASAAWRSPTGPALIEFAQRNGWLRADHGGRDMKCAPVPERARFRARHGMTFEKRLRRQRAQSLKSRRPVLDQLVADVLAKTASPDEVRYIVDELRRGVAATARKPKPVRSIKSAI